MLALMVGTRPITASRLIRSTRPMVPRTKPASSAATSSRSSMASTPIGKTVEVEYLRDGEKKTTKLTTISQDDFRKLTKEFEKRPEGRGQFGYEDGDSERVQVPGQNIYGVKLHTLLRSRPADLAGIKEGDIVIEFDGVPIRTKDELLMRVRRALPYSTVKVVVIRDGQKLEIPVKMGKQ